MLDWFKLKIVYTPITTLSFEEDDEDTALKQIRLKENGMATTEYGYAYFDLSLDPIKGLEPCKYSPKEESNLKTLTKVSFQSGEFIYAVGDCNQLYKELEEYLTKK